jgi:Tfp pilus assembly protein PilF
MRSLHDLNFKGSSHVTQPTSNTTHQTNAQSKSKVGKQPKRLALLIVLAAATTPGCAGFSQKSVWPFSKDTASATKPAGTSGFASTITGAGKSVAGQFQSMGTAVKSAAGKAKTAVIAPFSTAAKSDDPTSLSNMPTSLGPEVWVANGQLAETQGNYTKALDNYTKALEIEPTNLSALLSTARLYDRQGQAPQAAEFFQKAIKTKPDDAALYNELGLVKAKSGSAAEAEANIQKAIALDPTNSRYRNNLAGILVESGRSDEAVKQLEQVFAPAVANYNVAYLHASKQNIAAAQQHLQLALQIDPNLKEARDLMNRLGGSGAVQAASNAYNMAGNVMQSVQGMSGAYNGGAPAGVQAGAYAPSQPTPGQANLPAPPNGASQVLR